MKLELLNYVHILNQMVLCILAFLSSVQGLFSYINMWFKIGILMQLSGKQNLKSFMLSET